jgi:Putative beta-barrel porin-2, OmpL-like. bbp2
LEKKEERVASNNARQWVTVGVLGLALCGAAWADDAPAAAPTAAAEPGIDVTGYVDGYYSYNFNKPVDGLNGLHTYDTDHNSLSLSVVELAFEKKPTADSRAGFRTDLTFGPSADLTNAFEPSSFKTLANVQQAYVSFLASPKVQFDFGKFVTPIGAEVIESKDNWNYTRSIQFGWAIPFYHSGLRATITPSDKAVVAGYLVNGWNNVKDNNTDKTFIGQVILKPSGKFTWIGNVAVGKEVTDTRTLFDTVLTLTPSGKVSLMANFDYGKEGDASWKALSGYAKFQVNDVVAFSPRVEWMDDTDGGWATLGTKVMSATLTAEAKLKGGLLARADLRYDWADDAIFKSDTEGVLKDNQTGITLGFVYAFGGKI